MSESFSAGQVIFQNYYPRQVRRNTKITFVSSSPSEDAIEDDNDFTIKGHNSDPEVILEQERRLERQRNTRPPVTLFDKNQNYTLPTGDWRDNTYIINIPVKHNWKLLCRQAGFNASSRVAISGILSQPPGQALALLLASQCGVKNILGIDPLFPNYQRLRLQLMEDYRLLKRAVDVLELSVPQNPFGSAAGVDETVDTIISFQPTHMIHLDTRFSELIDISEWQTESQYFFSLHISLKYINRILQGLALAKKCIPSFLYVISTDTANEPRTILPYLLAKAFTRIEKLTLTKLILPTIFGPLVHGFNATKKFDLKKEIYVEEALEGILRAFIHNDKADVSAFIAQTMAIGGTDGEKPEKMSKVAKYWIAETEDWLTTKQYDELGNSKSNADYVTSFGVPQIRFPCPSRCESVHCLPSAFDSVVELSKKVTNGCDWILYTGNFSKHFAKLPRPRQDTKEEIQLLEAEQSDDSYVYVICRVAFVSGKSEFVRQLIKEDEESENFKDLLRTENGHTIKDGWTIIWLPEDTDETLSNADTALLRIDPSGLFPKHASKALYTEAKSFMKASNIQLTNTFKEMYRSRIGKRRKKARRSGTSIWQMVTVSAQRSRKVIFYAKEPWYPPENLDYFVENSDSLLPRRQIEFYKESMNLILSNSTRDSNNDLYKTFPLQWISTSTMIHDLATKWGQQLRCSWYQEHLHWGGSQDSEILSFAYIMGKRRIEGIYGPRLDEADYSWIPLLDNYYDFDPYNKLTRIANQKNQELFIRIIER